MANSVSGQGEPNRALWLATRAGKIELSCPLGTTSCIPQQRFPERHIINPLLTKLVRSRWLDIGLVLFLRVYGPRLRLGSKTQKKNLENIQPFWPHTWSITRMSTLRERNLKRHFLYENVSTETVFSPNYAGEFKNETITRLWWCFRFRKAPFRKCVRSTLECKGVAFKSSGLKSVFEMLRIRSRGGFV